MYCYVVTTKFVYCSVTVHRGYSIKNLWLKIRKKLNMSSTGERLL